MSLLQEMQMLRREMGEEKSDALERYCEMTGADIGKVMFTLEGWKKLEEWLESGEPLPEKKKK